MKLQYLFLFTFLIGSVLTQCISLNYLLLIKFILCLNFNNFQYKSVKMLKLMELLYIKGKLYTNI